jgi:FixJ family two-component response regulator
VAESVLAIAIVDDEEPIRKALGRLLRSVGYKVSTFSNGAEFLDSLEARQPDCTILDLHLPGLSGLEIQEYLRIQNIGIPCIIITGKDEFESRTQAMALGAAAYLTKPLDEHFLLSTITSAVFDHRRANKS